MEPKQLEDSGWVRAAGGFVVAPRLATVTPSHRVIDFFVVSRDLAGACGGTTHVSQHIAPRRPVRIVHAVDTAQEAGNEQAEAVASGEASWLQEAGVWYGLGPVRRRVPAAVGAQAG